MKRIPLTQDYEVIVGNQDFAYLSQWKWHAHPHGQTVYAQTNLPNGDGTFRTCRMHRMIMKATESQKVDHRDGNGLNNVRSNLRFTTFAGNQRNKGMSSNNKSGFKGVSWNKHQQQWVAQITAGGNPKHLGYFDDPRVAALTYDAAAVELHGEFAKTNEMMGLL